MLRNIPRYACIKNIIMDYSPYYFRREPKEKDRAVPQQAGYAAGGKRRGIRLEAVLLLIVFASLVTALILANVWSGEKILSAITGAFKDGDVYDFYTVAVGEYENEREAVVQATVIRTGGGAGYIYTEGGKYYVAMATYFDEESAKAVAEKNEGSFVYARTADVGRLYETSSDDAAIRRTVSDLTDALIALDGLCVGYASNEATAADTLTGVTEVRNSLYATKEYLYSIKADAGLLSALVSAVEPVFEGTEAVVMDNHSDELCAALRYIICAGVASLCALCAA